MLLYRSAVMLLFQSTLPREERPMPFTFFTRFKYFNPRSHERSDKSKPLFALWQSISIHAPTRGATTASADSSTLMLFQSTLPREERRMMLVNILLCNSISIHAPTRGATIQNDDASVLCLFQSTLPREERLNLVTDIPYHSLFQSTLPREERQQYCTKNLFIFIQYRQ